MYEIRTVFMGSPDFAVPILRRLAQEFLVIGVVTQPDRPAGRGQSLTPPPIKSLALELDLPFIQPVRLREEAPMQQLIAWNPDLIVVAAFGQILRSSVLNLPRYGCINVHASLLPRWRGAAPIQAALLNDDPQTGISIMQMDSGIDTGPILAQQAIPIEPCDTTASLSQRLAELGAQLLVDTLPGFLSANIQPQPQPETGITYAPMIKKEDGLLDFTFAAQALVCRVRAFNPWPGAFIYWNSQILKIHRAHAIGAPAQPPGKKTVIAGLPAIATGNGWLVLDEVQPAGKKIMPGNVFLQGARSWID
jgi:methionyl-tRNA formyltransferase